MKGRRRGRGVGRRARARRRWWSGVKNVFGFVSQRGNRRSHQLHPMTPPPSRYFSPPNIISRPPLPALAVRARVVLVAGHDGEAPLGGTWGVMSDGALRVVESAARRPVSIPTTALR